jgi:guanine nucleotide-binding protein subunit alpha
MMVFLPGPTDPFYELMSPPPDETSAQKTARLKRELDAQRVSDSIDEVIKQERTKERRKKNVIKVLLLGQAESGKYSLLSCCLTLKSLPSGKSTTLKSTDSLVICSFYNLLTLCLDFRMRYARAEWEKERNGWRSVVQLNVVRSIITIQNVIEAEMNGDAPVDSEDDEVVYCLHLPYNCDGNLLILIHDLLLSVFCVKDTTATAITLATVRDGVLRENLRASQLI